MGRIDDVIEQVEKGEAVNTDRVLALLALDFAKQDEQYVAEAAERQEQADGELGQWH